MTTHNEFLDSLPNAYVACRDLRHAWEVKGTYGPHSGVIVRRVLCPRCGTVKFQVIKDGRVASTSLKYPSDYVKGKAVERGRVSREVVIAQSLSRTTLRTEPRGDVAEFMKRRGIG